jgi:hypothetical protein
MNNLIKVLSICLMLLIAGANYLHSDGWFEGGRPVPDEKWRRHDGPFKALLIVTDHADALYEAWNNRPGNIPASTVTRVAPGTAVEAVVFFAGCQPDHNGNCQIAGVGNVISKSGRKVAKDVAVDIWPSRPAPPPPALGISEHGMGLVVTSEDLGYTFSLRLTDLVSKRSLVLERSFDVGKE